MTRSTTTSGHSALARAPARAHGPRHARPTSKPFGAMPMSGFPTPLRLLAPFAALLLIVPGAAPAQGISRQQVDELARDVGAVESIRAVKDLQRTYAQY